MRKIIEIIIKIIGNLIKVIELILLLPKGLFKVIKFLVKCFDNYLLLIGIKKEVKKEGKKRSKKFRVIIKIKNILKYIFKYGFKILKICIKYFIYIFVSVFILYKFLLIIKFLIIIGETGYIGLYKGRDLEYFGGERYILLIERYTTYLYMIYKIFYNLYIAVEADILNFRVHKINRHVMYLINYINETIYEDIYNKNYYLYKLGFINACYRYRVIPMDYDIVHTIETEFYYPNYVAKNAFLLFLLILYLVIIYIIIYKKKRKEEKGIKRLIKLKEKLLKKGKFDIFKFLIKKSKNVWCYKENKLIEENIYIKSYKEYKLYMEEYSLKKKEIIYKIYKNIVYKNIIITLTLINKVINYILLKIKLNYKKSIIPFILFVLLQVENTAATNDLFVMYFVMLDHLDTVREGNWFLDFLADDRYRNIFVLFIINIIILYIFYKIYSKIYIIIKDYIYIKKEQIEIVNVVKCIIIFLIIILLLWL
jgi:hypothetical protein